MEALPAHLSVVDDFASSYNAIYLQRYAKAYLDFGGQVIGLCTILIIWGAVEVTSTFLVGRRSQGAMERSSAH